MRTMLVLVVVGGCSGGHKATIDSGSPDAGGDSGSGCADGDGDGVCDAVDVCPSVPDPGQVDLDHDHIGWMCDPVEGTDVQTTGYYSFYPAAQRDLFASLWTYSCTSSACTDVVVAADATGSVIGRSDSGSPADAWLAGGDLTGPFISSDGQLLWSRGLFQGDLGRLALASGTYTPEAAGPIYNSRFAGTRGNTPLLALWAGTSEVNVVAPANGTLASVDSAPYGVDVIQTGDSFVTFDNRSQGGSTGELHSLHEYKPGDASATIVEVGGAPATDLDELVPWPGGPTGTTAYCMNRASSVTYVQIAATGVTQVPLPFVTDCTMQATFVGATLYLYASTIDHVTTAAFIRDGALTTIFSDSSTISAATIDGDALQLFSIGYGNTARAWAITATNQVTQLGADLTNISGSIYGNTAAVVGLSPTTNGFANLVIERWRPASGLERVVVQGSVPISTQPSALVTAEEAVIAESQGYNWSLPSASLTPVALDLRYTSLAVARDGHTFIFGQKSAPTSQPAAYAYDEVGGVPRLTQLTAEQQGSGAYLLDSRPGPLSSWYMIASTSCSVVRLVTDATGTPALDSIPSPCAMRWLDGGRSPDAAGDAMIVLTSSTSESLYVLGPGGGHEVARGSDFSAILDASARFVVGWAGNDSLGGFVCMATHPDHCWTVPPASSKLDVFTGLWDGPDGGFSAARSLPTSSGVTLTIVRTLDGGNRPQPLL